MTEIKSTNSLSKTDLGIAAFIWLLAFSLYVRTLAPSLLWDDSAEIQTLSYTLGMAHGSGYVTYIMIANLFTKIPVGNIAYRVNLASAFFGALAAAQVFLIARVLGSRRPAAFAASALLALMERFWTLSIIAELYASSAAIIAAIWLFVLLWNQTEKWEYLFVAGALGGLSLGIHNSILMTGASVLIYLALSARKKSAWIAAAAGAGLGALLTLSAFLYLDAHDPPSSIYNTVYRPALEMLNVTPETFDTPFERLIAILPDDSFWSYYFTAPQDVIFERLAESLALFPWWATTLIFAGGAALFLRTRWYDGLYPLVSFLLIWGLAVTISLSSYRDFYVPSAVMAAVWFGVGASAFLDGLEKIAARIFNQREMLRAGAMFVVALGLMLLPLFHSRADIRMAVEKGRTEFIRRDHVYPFFSPDKALDEARKTLKRVDANAIVFVDWNRLYGMVYTAELVADRQDVTFHEADVYENFRLSEAYVKYIDAQIDSRPIYFMTLMENLGDYYLVEQVGDSLYRLRRK